MSCAVYLSSNFNPTQFNIHFSWNFSIQSGFNILPLSQPVSVIQGSFIAIVQTTGLVAIDKNGNATYSDMLLNNGVFYNLSLTSNWRFYLKANTNFSSYANNFSIYHMYTNPGAYSIFLTFNSSNKILPYTVLINQCKYA